MLFVTEPQRLVWPDAFLLCWRTHNQIGRAELYIASLVWKPHIGFPFPMQNQSLFLSVGFPSTHFFGNGNAYVLLWGKLCEHMARTPI